MEKFTLEKQEIKLIKLLIEVISVLLINLIIKIKIKAKYEVIYNRGYD